MATRSTPMVSNRPEAWAISALVPTPSVDDTSTGWRYRWLAKANSPPNPPMSPMTSGRNVERTLSLMRCTASSPASMLTPAASYVSPIRRDPSSSGRATGLLVAARFVGGEQAAAEQGLGGGTDRGRVATGAAL